MWLLNPVSFGFSTRLFYFLFGFIYGQNKKYMYVYIYFLFVLFVLFEEKNNGHRRGLAQSVNIDSVDAAELKLRCDRCVAACGFASAQFDLSDVSQFFFFFNVNHGALEMLFRQPSHPNAG